MRLLIVMLMTMTLFVSPLFSQSTPTTDVEKARREAQLGDFNDRVDALRNSGKQLIIRDRYKETRTYQDSIVPLYRDLKNNEADLLAPSAADLEKFSGYVGKENAGIIRLIADKGCDIETGVVVSNMHCDKYKMPGAGASYSFRKRMYRMRQLSDISFTGSDFTTKSFWKHGILIELGNLPLDELTIKSQELATLVGFQVEMNREQASLFEVRLSEGVSGGGITYKDSHPVSLNTTYVIRSIAYQGENWQSLNDVTYDEFEFDDRRDVVVAFHVVSYIPDESVTLIWKKLSDKKAPKISDK